MDTTGITQACMILQNNRDIKNEDFHEFPRRHDTLNPSQTMTNTETFLQNCPVFLKRSELLGNYKEIFPLFNML